MERGPLNVNFISDSVQVETDKVSVSDFREDIYMLEDRSYLMAFTLPILRFY